MSRGGFGADRGGVIRFGSFVLDEGARELRRDGLPVELEPRTFDLLAYLVANRDRVVPKTELLDELWGDRFVGESALSSQIKHARAAVGDNGRTQSSIRTTHRVGYRFVAETHSDLAVAGKRAPIPSQRLYGREEDVEAVLVRLTDHRLVTIVGPGGVGKTSLAVACLDKAPSQVAETTWICELANTRDPDAVGSLVLAAIGESQHSDADPIESLVRILERRRGILVLDNCEHVADAARQVAQAVLDACGRIQLVATSRVPLGLAAESVHPLAPLAPADAIECFRARAADAGVQIHADEPSLVELCMRLDCIPLALELAAARCRVVSVPEMLELLADRFRLLDTTAVGDDARHQSLHRTIAWSWDGLSRPDQQALSLLSVFVSWFTLEDAGAILGLPERIQVVESMQRLVNSSLVSPGESLTGPRRFRLLESVRDFATAKLDEPTAARASHARHFADLAVAWDTALQTPELDSAVAEISQAWPNLRTAVLYAAEAGDLELARQIIAAVGLYGELFGLFEILEWCETAEVREPGPGATVVACEAAAVKARLLAHRGHQEQATSIARAASQELRSFGTELAMLESAYYRGDLDEVLTHAGSLVGLARSDRGFEGGFAEGFAAMVVGVRQQADLTSAAVVPADADAGLLGVLDCFTAAMRVGATDPETAASLLEAVVAASLRNDYRLLLGAAASSLTALALPERPDTEAMHTLRRTLQMYIDRGMWTLISADTVTAARLLADHGEAETACRLLGARKASGYAVGLSEILRTFLAEELEAQMGERYVELAQQGAQWRPPEAGRYAIAALGRALGAEA